MSSSCSVLIDLRLSLVRAYDTDLMSLSFLGCLFLFLVALFHVFSIQPFLAKYKTHWRRHTFFDLDRMRTWP